MARFIGEEPQIFGGGGEGGQGGRGGPGRLVFRCWAHKQPDMKEAGEGWKEFYRLFCLRTGATGVVPVPPIPPPPPSPAAHAAAVAAAAAAGGGGGGGMTLGIPLSSPLLPMTGAFLGVGGNAEGTIVNVNGGGFGGGGGGEGEGKHSLQGVCRGRGWMRRGVRGGRRRRKGGGGRRGGREGGRGGRRRRRW